MNTILSWITSKLTPILMVALVVLAIACAVLLLSNSRKDRTIDNLQYDVTILQRDNELLEQRLTIAAEINRSLDSANTTLSNTNTQTRTDTEGVIEALTKLSGTSNEKTNSSSGNTLDSDSIRLLNEQCQRIRGSACTNP